MDSLQELQRSLGRVEGKMDSLIEMHQATEQRQSIKIADLDTRVGKSEKFQSRILGYSAGITCVVGVIYAIVALIK